MASGSSTNSGLLADWAFYTLNNHVLLAAFFGHSAHPSPLYRRRLVCATSLAFGFFLSACLFLAGRGTTLQAVPEGYSVTLWLLTSLKDFPTTVAVALQLVWDIAGGSLGSWPCVRVGPPGMRKTCTLAMLCCLVCQQLLLGIVFLTASGVLLLLFGGLWLPERAWRLTNLFLRSKLLAYLLEVPASTGIFFALRHAELDGQYDAAGGRRASTMKLHLPETPSQMDQQERGLAERGFMDREGAERERNRSRMSSPGASSTATSIERENGSGFPSARLALW